MQATRTPNLSSLSPGYPPPRHLVARVCEKHDFDDILFNKKKTETSKISSLKPAPSRLDIFV